MRVTIGKKHRVYLYRDDHGDFTYGSWFKLGSWGNYTDFETNYLWRYGKFNERPTWERYREWTKTRIYREA